MISGLDKLEQDIANIGINSTKMINKASKEIFATSQSLVPVNKVLSAPTRGQLKASGKITPIKNGVEISYKAMNGSFDYAIIQHNNKGFNHAPGKTSHYLENAVDIDKLMKMVSKGMIK